MRLDEGDRVAGVGGKRLRGADLIGDQPLDFVRRKGHRPPSESPEIRKGRVGANVDAPLPRHLDGTGHDFGIAGMKAARDVGRSHHAEAFTHVGI